MDLTISKIDKIANILQVSTSEILNFNPENYFNISNNNNNDRVIGNENNNYYYTVDPHTKKYITILEQENERLKNQIGN